MSISEKLITITENVSKVYEKGKDYIWEVVQQKGKRKDYSYAFAHWDTDYIRPKYKVVPTDVASGNQPFSKSKIKKVETEYFDFSQKPRGTTYSQGWYYTFSTCSKLEEIEDIGMQADYYYMWTFPWCYNLHTIEVLRTDENTFWGNAFDSCYALKNLTIEGTIGQNGFNVRWSTELTKESLLSILKALSLDITTTTTITFSTVHQSIIETDSDCKPYWQAAKDAGWSFVYA